MSDQDVSSHEAKVLADLLALSLADSGPQAEAAIHAIRRRATRDSVTGGAVKALVQRLMMQSRLEAGEPQQAELPQSVADLHWVLEDQKRELEETRHARQLSEHATSDARQTNMALADRIGGLTRARRVAWVLGFALGVGCTVAGYAGLGVARQAHFWELIPDGVPGPQAHLNGPASAQLDDFLHSCFLASTNSLGTRSSFATHVLLDIGADGTIAGATAVQDPTADGDANARQYNELMVRTLGDGSCGKLPLPASLQGRTSHLDLLLPR